MYINLLIKFGSPGRQTCLGRHKRIDCCFWQVWWLRHSETAKVTIAIASDLQTMHYHPVLPTGISTSDNVRTLRLTTSVQVWIVYTQTTYFCITVWSATEKPVLRLFLRLYLFYGAPLTRMTKVWLDLGLVKLTPFAIFMLQFANSLFQLSGWSASVFLRTQANEPLPNPGNV